MWSIQGLWANESPENFKYALGREKRRHYYTLRKFWAKIFLTSGRLLLPVLLCLQY